MIIMVKTCPNKYKINIKILFINMVKRDVETNVKPNQNTNLDPPTQFILLVILNLYSYYYL